MFCIEDSTSLGSPLAASQPLQLMFVSSISVSPMPKAGLTHGILPHLFTGQMLMVMAPGTSTKGVTPPRYPLGLGGHLSKAHSAVAG